MGAGKIAAITAAFALTSGVSVGRVNAAEMQPSPDCDRACLYGVLDKYLDALKARDTRKVTWAAHVKNSENNVMLRPGDGLWGTITALDSYEMRFADVSNGTVAISASSPRPRSARLTRRDSRS